MSRYDHPLTSEPREERDQEETYELEDVDVTARVSSDGKRVRLTVIDEDGEETFFKLGGATLNGTPFTASEPVNLYGVDIVIEWQSGGIGLFPGVDLQVTRDLQS